jgi:hypothetical protein
LLAHLERKQHHLGLGYVYDSFSKLNSALAEEESVGVPSIKAES